MMLEMPEHQEEMQCNLEFGKIKSLQILLVEKKVGFLRSPATLPNSLRVLEWPGCPATSLPHDFHLKNLVILDLSYSYFGWDKPLENSKVLRHLIVVGCKNIRRIPDISGFHNLTKLCVGECTNLIEIHDSVGSLLHLKVFCAEGCTKLTIGLSRIELKSLEHLCFPGCSSLVMFPEVLAPMHKLNHVDLGGTGIRNLPPSMQNLKGIKVLSMGKGQMLEINESSNFFQNLPMFFPNLETLYLQNLDITILPASIEECHSLKFLHVTNCKKLQEIRGLPLNINQFYAANCSVKANSLILKLRQAIDSAAMRICFLPGREIPELFDHSSGGNSTDKSIEECHSLKFLHVTNCKKLQEIRGLPLNINQFYAANCSVKANSLILKLRQAIDSAAMRICFLPGREIPELFDHSSGGNSTDKRYNNRNRISTQLPCDG
ncbi:disease resistance protein RML1B-like [Vigna umbellata]|uniref:disease resistance protein RML1B-like n=1 Tax=Vigna umbellata TaxID=87088 RepID=UPI001F5EFD11|nr:disease resistance protein RML1B-like [Vigna umbellata]